MQGKHRLSRTPRWLLSVLIVTAGLTTAWGWSSVGEPDAPALAPVTPVLYAAWQPGGAPQTLLFRSTDHGLSWEPLMLPDRATPMAWAGDGANRVAVSLSNGPVFRSEDRGESWKQVAGELLPVLSLAWDGQGDLYFGTAGHGIYRQTAGGAIEPIAAGQQDLASESVSHLVLVGGRLFAATPTALFYTDDGGQSWGQAQPVARGISALAAADARTLFVGTPANGLFRSVDAGQTWQPASAGLGQAAGVYLSITALQIDRQEAGVLYAAVSSLVGGTQLHSAAMGTFVTLDGGQSWQPLAGPSFPQAKPASALVPAPDQPLFIWSVATDGLQSYTPDVAGALATLQQSTGDVQSRATAARLLGLARTQAANDSLLAAVSDPSPAVSQAAGEALGRIADSRTTSDLLLALQSPIPQVQRSAATALGMLRAGAAVEEGIVPGGGVALINAVPALADIKMEFDDEQTGVTIVRRALEEPMRQLAINAGKDGAVIVDNVRRQQKEQDDVKVGYDVLREVYVNMVEQGIIDPVKVTRSAVENAASIGAMILSTEALITDIPEKEQPQMPQMPEY